ncbi:MAG: hypothetical protein Q8P61_06280 [Candidatus Nanopelagicales bacterium]|nr:hypothetical protein [Candidatus Nanopelagicales bacterium]
MGRIGAGHRAAVTRRNNAMQAQMTAQMTALRAQYDSAGKRQIRALLHALARETSVRTVLEFLGGGEGAEAWVSAGFQVTVAEMQADRKKLLAWDADRLGYTPFASQASRLKRLFDLIFADFDGPLSDGTSEPELRELAAMTGKWLAVTVSPDRQRDELLQVGKSPYADATMAARLAAITGLRLVYLRRYKRNDYGQWMWFALLDRATPRRRYLNIPMIHDGMTSRGWWANPHSAVAQLEQHKRHVRTNWWSRWTSTGAGGSWAMRKDEHRRAHLPEYARRKREYRWRNHEKSLERERAYQAANPDKVKAWHQAYRERHRDRIRAANAAWRLKKRLEKEGTGPVGDQDQSLAA